MQNANAASTAELQFAHDKARAKDLELPQLHEQHRSSAVETRGVHSNEPLRVNAELQ